MTDEAFAEYVLNLEQYWTDQVSDLEGQLERSRQDVFHMQSELSHQKDQAEMLTNARDERTPIFFKIPKCPLWYRAVCGLQKFSVWNERPSAWGSARCGFGSLRFLVLQSSMAPLV